MWNYLEQVVPFLRRTSEELKCSPTSQHTDVQSTSSFFCMYTCEWVGLGTTFFSSS